MDFGMDYMSSILSLLLFVVVSLVGGVTIFNLAYCIGSYLAHILPTLPFESMENRKQNGKSDTNDKEPLPYLAKHVTSVGGEGELHSESCYQHQEDRDTAYYYKSDEPIFLQPVAIIVALMFGHTRIIKRLSTKCK